MSQAPFILSCTITPILLISMIKFRHYLMFQDKFHVTSLTSNHTNFID